MFVLAHCPTMKCHLPCLFGFWGRIISLDEHWVNNNKYVDPTSYLLKLELTSKPYTVHRGT